MSNELLFFLRGLLGLLFLLYIAKLSKGWLYGYIVANLLLISTMGGKFAEVFGHVSNIGNVFYASVVLALYLLVDRYGTAAAYRGVRIGAAMVGFFILMSFLTLAMTGTEDSRFFDVALHVVLHPGGRVALASVLAFLISQYINVWIFDAWQKRLHGKYIWLRATVCNAGTQILDTGLFFLIAFVGMVSSGSLFGAMLSGYLVKVLFVSIGAVFFMTKDTKRVRSVE